MAKPKSPLLSFGARGTIADSLTFQKRGRGHFAREKPIPKDPYTLAQAYQRWDYQDYAYLWTLQTQAVKQTYHTRASRYHITGFSLWMREHLKDLPDLAGRWHLDEKAGVIAHDSSKQGHNLTIIGASPAPGLINGGFYFDGINDYLTAPPTGSLLNFTAKTIEFFIKPTAFTGLVRGVYSAGWDTAPWGDEIRLRGASNILRLLLKNTLGVLILLPIPYTPGVSIHIAFTWDGTTAIAYKDGTPVFVPQPFTGILDCSSTPLYFARIHPDFNAEIHLDHLIIYRRALDPTEIKRHAERRYPS